MVIWGIPEQSNVRRGVGLGESESERLGVDCPGYGVAEEEIWDGAVDWNGLMYLMDGHLHLIIVHV